jgi:HAD superfamily hydrolase (TIGR01509 family)
LREATSPRGEEVSASGPIQALVFDCDGVIADTIAVWNQAFSTVASRHGMELGADHYASLHGSAIDPASRQLARWMGGLVTAAELAEELNEELFVRLASAPMAPSAGLAGLLSRISGVVPVAVASNAPRRAVLRVLARLDLTWHFCVVVGADDVQRPKPAADPYVAACARLGADPSRSLAVEDSEIGAISADSAGLGVVELAPSAWECNGSARRPAALRITTLADPRLTRLALGH